MGAVGIVADGDAMMVEINRFSILLGDVGDPSEFRLDSSGFHCFVWIYPYPFVFRISFQLMFVTQI